MPDINKIHQDRPLTEISIKYKKDGLIADLATSFFPVKKKSNDYYVYSKDNFRLVETLRANRAEANEVDWDISTASYSLEKHSLKHLVTDDEIDEADEAIDMEVDATEMLTDIIMLRREKSFIDLISTNGNWANESSLAAAGAWSANTTVSDPVLVIDSATSSIIKNSGQKPNTVIMDYRSFQAAKEHVSIKDRVKYTSADSITEGMLAKMFNIDKLFVSFGIANSADEGLADSMGYLMTDTCWVGYIERSPGKKKVSALYTFIKGGKSRVKKWREENREGVFIEVTSEYQHKPVATDCGYLIVDTIQ